VCVCVCVTLLTSSSILFQPFNHPQSCPTKRNTRKSHLYYFICPVTSLLHTALRLRSSRMLHRVVGRWVRSTQLTPSLPHWRWRQQVSADMVPIYRSTKCHITEDHTLHVNKCNHFKSHIVQNVITLLGLWYWLYAKYVTLYKLKYVNNVVVRKSDCTLWHLCINNLTSCLQWGGGGAPGWSWHVSWYSWSSQLKLVNDFMFLLRCDF